MQVRKILVPLDGSPLGEAAIPTAAGMAAPAGAEIILLRAVQAQRFPGLDLGEAEIRVVAEAEAYLATLTAQLAAAGLRGVVTAVWYGPAASSIVEAAQLYPADLIVMSTHGRSGLGRLILGSVAESVLRGTRTPILMVRDGQAPVASPSGGVEARPWLAATPEASPGPTASVGSAAG
jgi:nucleotide-binding universal stress UspA family protein